MTLTVNKSGRVTATDVRPLGLVGPAEAECVSDVASEMVFAVPLGTTMVEFRIQVDSTDKS